ncbi:MAG: DDE-type integrase/transposase/recombinase [Limimaricola sp.]|nr:DDE-type integrase/transposase/recombinase [Limimaricola sp.]
MALQALLAAVWRRKPKRRGMTRSDQGSQFTSREWQTCPRQHNLNASMSRRGNCHDLTSNFTSSGRQQSGAGTLSTPTPLAPSRWHWRVHGGCG